MKMQKLKVLNLYAGIGGNRKLWPDDEIEVIAIENNESIANIYKDFFPNDKMMITDAHQYLLEHFEEFDFIWSSPPCQSHSGTNHFLFGQGIRRYPDLKLYEEIIFLTQWCKKRWVVENVKPYYKPLIAAAKKFEEMLKQLIDKNKQTKMMPYKTEDGDLDYLG